MPGEKRHPATKHRIREAIAQGDVARSKDLSGFFVLSVGVSWLFFITTTSGSIQKYYINLMHQLADFQTENMLLYARIALGVLAEILAPFLAVIFLAALLIEFAQVGFKIKFSPVSFKLSRLNLAENIKNIFRASKSSPPTKLAFELIRRGLLLLLSVGAFIALLIFVTLELLYANLSDVSELVLVIRQYSLRVTLPIFGIFSLYALVDFLVSRRRWKDRLRMDSEEFKKELRDTEGNPELKGMRNQLHQEILQKSLIEGVRRAQVVVSNRR